jgi:hypothetical protein
MSDIRVPHTEWREFLDAFSMRHRGWLVRMEIHDRETGEDVGSRYMHLNRIELDTEDAINPRINITVDRDHKIFKHVLFRPSCVTLHLSSNGADESLNIESLNTSTTIRFRATVLPDLVDGVA